MLFYNLRAAVSVLGTSILIFENGFGTLPPPKDPATVAMLTVSFLASLVFFFQLANFSASISSTFKLFCVFKKA